MHKIGNLVGNCDIHAYNRDITQILGYCRMPNTDSHLSKILMKSEIAVVAWTIV